MFVTYSQDPQLKDGLITDNYTIRLTISPILLDLFSYSCDIQLQSAFSQTLDQTLDLKVAC